MPHGPHDLLTVADVVQRTKLSKPFVYALIDRGELPAHRFGSAVRISFADLEDFIAARRTVPA